MADELTRLNAPKEEKKGKSAKYPRDLRFRVFVELIDEEPCLENTSRIEETRGWKQSQPRTQDDAIRLEATVGVGLEDDGIYSGRSHFVADAIGQLSQSVRVSWGKDTFSCRWKGVMQVGCRLLLR